jgi:hypothetical protein
MAPLYQYWCDPCFEPYEIEMDLKTKDKYDRGKLKESLKCPKCETELTYLIAPPKTIKIN